MEYECCICKETVSAAAGARFDPCALLLIANYEEAIEAQKEQQFFCHFECFRQILNNDGVLYIMETDFPTRGEIDREETDPANN